MALVLHFLPKYLERTPTDLLDLMIRDANDTARLYPSVREEMLKLVREIEREIKRRSSATALPDRP